MNKDVQWDGCRGFVKTSSFHVRCCKVMWLCVLLQHTLILLKYCEEPYLYAVHIMEVLSTDMGITPALLDDMSLCLMD